MNKTGEIFSKQGVRTVNWMKDLFHYSEPEGRHKRMTEILWYDSQDKYPSLNGKVYNNKQLFYIF